MSFEVAETNIFAHVKDEAPLWNAGVLGDQQFVPDWAKLIYMDGKLTIFVTGPLLNAKGEPYKAKRGFYSYDQDQINDGSAPIWVQQLAAKVPGR